MTSEELIQELKDKVSNPPTWLSARNDYARGYRNGCLRVYEELESLLNSLND